MKNNATSDPNTTCKQTNITILNQNVRCISNCVDQISALLEDVPGHHVACISEHWQSEDQLVMLKLPNLQLITSYCRPPNLHGGVAIYCDKDMVSTPIQWFDDLIVQTVFECCAIQVKFNSSKFIVVCVYHPSGSDDEVFITNFHELVTILFQKNIKFYIAGDFNIDTLVKSKYSKMFTDILESFELKLTINEVTRESDSGGSCLDNIIVNKYDDYFVQNFNACISDHWGQLLTFNTLSQKKCKQSVRFFTEDAMREFCNDLEGENFLQVYEVETVDLKYNTFINVFLTYFNKHFPLKTLNNKREKIKFKSTEISTAKNNMIHYQHLSLKYPQYKDNFKKAQKEYNKLLQDEKNKYFEQRLLNSKNKSKTSWQIIYELTGNKKRKTEQPYFEDYSKGANDFNFYFNEVTTKIIQAKLPQSTSYVCNIPYHRSTFSFELIDSNTLLTIMSNIEGKKSSGYDNVSCYLLKQCFRYVCEPLTHIINCSLGEGYFPSNLKYSVIKPCFKKGDPASFDNYRQISLLSSFSKLFEKTVYIQLFNYLINEKLISTGQHGFFTGRNTESALFEILNNVYCSMESGDVSCGIFLDLSRAFDCVDFEILLKKLEHYGVRNRELNWFRTYIYGRLQSVKLKDPKTNSDIRSDALGVCRGVPQGSVLGPLLFIIYVNDLASLIHNNQSIVKYADDTTIFLQATDFPELVSKANSMMNDVEDWFQKCRLILNEEKTKAIFFKTSSNLDTPSKLTLPNYNIPFDTEIKCLGIWIDDILKFSYHIGNLRKELNKACYGLRILAKNNHINLARTFYFSNFYAKARYGIIIWGGSTDVVDIFRIQKNAIRILGGLDYRESCKGKFKTLNLLTIPALYIYECVKFMFKNQHYFDSYRRDHEYNTRNAIDYSFPQHRLTCFKKSTLYSCIKFFNHLPIALKAKQDFNQIKKPLLSILYKLEPYNVNDFLDTNLNNLK